MFYFVFAGAGDNDDGTLWSDIAICKNKQFIYTLLLAFNFYSFLYLMFSKGEI